MTSFAPIPGLIGGILIGLSAVILMLTIGRTAGIGGIVVNAMTGPGVWPSLSACRWARFWSSPLA